MEGGGGDPRLTLHCLHHLPQLPWWVPYRTGYRDLNPLGQTASEGYVHEGGSPPRNIPGPTKVIKYIGKVQVPGNTEGIWRGAQGSPLPSKILGEAPNGGAGRGGGVLRRTLPLKNRLDTGVYTVAHHLKCGGGRSGPPLGVTIIWGAGGDNSDDNKARHPIEGWTIRGRDDRQSRTEEIHARLKLQAIFLYSDNVMVASTNPVWLQTVFEMLMGIFERVGLQTNIQKTVGIVFQRCRAVGVRADEAYKHRMMGEGQVYQ